MRTHRRQTAHDRPGETVTALSHYRLPLGAPRAPGARRAVVVLFALVVAVLCVAQSAPACTALMSSLRLAAASAPPTDHAPGAPATGLDAAPVPHAATSDAAAASPGATDAADTANAATATASTLAAFTPATATSHSPAPAHTQRDARQRPGAAPLAAAGAPQAGLAAPTSSVAQPSPRASGARAAGAAHVGRAVTLLLSINRT